MYLLDTNALIIMMFGDVAQGRLTEETLERIESADEIFVSEISFWEIAIKVRIGKLEISQPVTYIADQCRAHGIDTISVTIGQFAATMDVPFVKEHQDPFDRLILAIAKMDGYTLVSTDGKLRKYRDTYGIDLLW